MQIRILYLLVLFSTVSFNQAFAFGENHVFIENPAQTSWHNIDNHSVKLDVAKYDSIQKEISLSVTFNLGNDWKMYSNEKTELGIPLAFDAKQSTNVASISPIFPPSLNIIEDLGVEKITSKVYKGKVLIPLKIGVANSNIPVNLNLDIKYSICNKICIPCHVTFQANISPNFYNSEDKSPNDSQYNLIYVIILAILGGFILNLMPCVLPVLSIKLLSIIKQHGLSKYKIRINLLTTALGIISSFLVIAISMIALRYFGYSIGFGMQFQSPIFLVTIVIILSIFIANLLGFFEISLHNSLHNKIDKTLHKTNEHKLISYFLSGVFATIMATPCTAPFLGTSISFAFATNNLNTLTIFFFLGFGMSIPYILLIISPSFIKILPKPGNWMLKVKQIFAIFLFATITWLCYILLKQIGTIGGLLIFILSVVTILQFKFYRNLQKKRRFILYIVWFLTLSLFYVLVIIAPINSLYNLKIFDRGYVNWQRFDESKISSYVQEGKIVFVDITADWCMTCKMNELLVLSNKDVVNLLKSNRVIAMKGDLTNPDESISRYLNKNKRYGIPFNAIYSKQYPNGKLLPELLHKKELIEMLNIEEN